MEIVDVEENLNSELKNNFKGLRDGFVQVGEKKWFYPKKFRKCAEELKNFQVRSDDIWITGYPRSGTTVTEELTWLLSHNFDFEESKKTSISLRVRFFEGRVVTCNTLIKELLEKVPEDRHIFQRMEDTLKILDEEKSRRVMKTHLPFELLPEDVINKGCKVIYVCRYPKDVCVSHYHLQSSSRHIGFCGGFEKYWQYFKNGNCIFGPYFEHVKQGFQKSGNKNFLFVFYEDFRKDKEAFIRKLADFLEIPTTDEQLKELCQYIEFENYQKTAHVEMKDSNNKLIDFVRKGKVGGWKEYFTEDLSQEADEWIEENTRKIGIKYPQQE